jgi:hypothetical protein
VVVLRHGADLKDCATRIVGLMEEKEKEMVSVKGACKSVPTIHQREWKMLI